MQRCLAPTKPEKKSVETERRRQLGLTWRQAAERAGVASAYQIFEYEVEAEADFPRGKNRRRLEFKKKDSKNLKFQTIKLFEQHWARVVLA